MLVTSALNRIRRFLGDEDSAVFSDDMLVGLYNEKRREFFFNTDNKIKFTVIPNPPLVEWNCTHEWERGEFDYYTRKWGFDNIDSVATQPWELSLDKDNGSEGGYSVSTLTDTSYVKPINHIIYPLPIDLGVVLYAAWRGNRIDQETQSNMDFEDFDWMYRQSDEVDYFTLSYDNGFPIFSPYPHPQSASFEVQGTGLPIYMDVADVDEGEAYLPYIATALEIENIGEGIITYLASSENGFTFMYSAIPEDIDINDIETQLPALYQRFVEYGVVSRAFGADTELKDLNKKDFFNYRFISGIELVVEAQRTSMPNLTISVAQFGEQSKRRKKPPYPRFPDGYPDPWS